MTAKYDSFLKTCGVKIPKKRRKIIFCHTRALGDALMFTAGIRDFKLAFPTIDICADSNFKELFENNPYVNWDLIDQWEEQKAGKKDHGIEYYRVGYPNINNSNNASSHFTQGFFWDMVGITNAVKPLPSRAYSWQNMDIGEFASMYMNGEIGDPPLFKFSKDENDKWRYDVGGKDEDNPPKEFEQFTNDQLEHFIRLQKQYQHFCKDFTRIRADLHISDEEKRHSLVKEAYGVEDYWIVAPGGKRDCTCKMWDWRRFQEVVDHFKGQINFVTIGKSDHLVTKLKGVIDLTDKFNSDIRGLVQLGYHALGGIGGVTFLLHLMGALEVKKAWCEYSDGTKGMGRKPFICLVGGREPLTYTTYNQVHSLHSCGIYTCAIDGGCWKSRIVPLSKEADLNKNLCMKPVKIEGRTIQECMHHITSYDIIRLLERIYSGDIYKPINPVTKPIRLIVKEAKVEDEEKILKNEPKSPRPHQMSNTPPKKMTVEIKSVEIDNKKYKIEKEINVLASLHSGGGGEQSVLKICQLLSENGWKVHVWPWANVSKQLTEKNLMPLDWSQTKFIEKQDTKMPDFKWLAGKMKKDIPLLFYANDQIWDFCKGAQPIVEECSELIVCINWANGDLPRWTWLDKSGKLKAVIFHCDEKRLEFERDRFGFTDTQQVVLFGAIELEKFLEVQTKPREKDEPLVVVKHCVADNRKYVTSETQPGGDKKHVWQHHFWKDSDMDLYSKLLKKFKDIRFEFMAAPEEIREFFKDEERMVFHKWDAMPVTDFLAKGHVYFYRTSNHWRDNYPRVVAEALAAGLPVISEPRDGTKDRVQHGDTGFYACHYDEVELHIGTLKRKETLRQAMGLEAKRWAQKNLDPIAWVKVLEELLL